MNPFITSEGNGRAKTNAYIKGACMNVGMDILKEVCACPVITR